MRNDIAELGLDVRDRIRANWFRSVREISDIDLQRRMWLDPDNHNPYWSYIEFVENFPDVGQLADFHSRSWLNPHEFAILTDLSNKLSGHTLPAGDDCDNASILADPKWVAIVADAESARRKLLTLTVNESEQKVLSPCK